jgi:hypothetical protein
MSELNPENMIFVFGSNEAGIHGSGAAAFAVLHRGAKMRVGRGLQGQSYAIPTKDSKIRTRPLAAIQEDVDDFKLFAAQHPEMNFQVTRIGCGLAGYTDEQIMPMFGDPPDNCWFPPEWEQYGLKVWR